MSFIHKIDQSHVPGNVVPGNSTGTVSVPLE